MSLKPYTIKDLTVARGILSAGLTVSEIDREIKNRGSLNDVGKIQKTTKKKKICPDCGRNLIISKAALAEGFIAYICKKCQYSKFIRTI